MGDLIFRGYDREALDREYDNRAKVANAAEVLAWYARESEATRGKLECRLDVPYGSHPGETLDIFPAAGATADGAPVHVFIHGGYWHRLDKGDFSYVARGFVPAGAAIVVINYALIPTVDMDELVRQCRAALAWVHGNARTFGGDPARVSVSGHSAGGHLVAMLMATDWAAFAGLPAEVVSAGCAISGLYDLEPIRLCYLNDVLALTPDDVRRHSPVLLAPARPTPLLLAVGAREGPEYHRQTEDLAAAWRRRGTPCEVMDMRGHDHFSIAVQLGDPSSELSRAILRLATVGGR
jgi:arylformamidase